MIQKPRGTQDYLGSEFISRRELENKFVEFYVQKGYKGLETPIFEQRGLFVRSVGEKTDIVQKELFDLGKKSDEIYSLRPEFTAGVVRSLIEMGIKSMPLPVKVISLGPCFRYERPQKGRKRQFNQLNVELIGKKSPEIDAEVIFNGYDFLKSIGLNVKVQINTLGSEETRKIYSQKLQETLNSKKEQLCEKCKIRAKINPLRIWDCKDPNCNPVAIPAIWESLSEQEMDDYKEIKMLLAKKEVSFDESFGLVRGLDYYTGIIFEYTTIDDTQRLNSLGGGGRYDNLIKKLGGPDLPAIGYGLGFERIVEQLKEKVS